MERCSVREVILHIGVLWRAECIYIYLSICMVRFERVHLQRTNGCERQPAGLDLGSQPRDPLTPIGH